jgi:hypothetical protein
LESWLCSSHQYVVYPAFFKHPDNDDLIPFEDLMTDERHWSIVEAAISGCILPQLRKGGSKGVFWGEYIVADAKKLSIGPCKYSSGMTNVDFKPICEVLRVNLMQHILMSQ